MLRNQWRRLIGQAEQLVGYPGPFLNLRYLLSDELNGVATQVRSLVGSRHPHPLLRTAKSLIDDGRSLTQTRGLLVLMLSRCLSEKNGRAAATAATAAAPTGILPAQRSLAEIIETVHVALAVHRGLVDMETQDAASNVPLANCNGKVAGGARGTATWRKEMELGNKLATLSGDFLLASVSTALAELRNAEVVELISRGIGDMIEAEFTSFALTAPGNQHDPLQQVAMQPQPALRLEDWAEFVRLSRGSMLGRCCRAAVMLCSGAGDNAGLAEAADRFGQEWSYFYRLVEETGQVTSADANWPGFTLAEAVPQYHQSNGAHKEVLSDLLHHYGQRTIAAIGQLPQGESAALLTRMVLLFSGRQQ